MSTSNISDPKPRNAEHIATLIEDARREGCWYPRDPFNPDGVQIRLHRSASADGHRLATILRERRDEINRFVKERRPAWPDIPDDEYGPRLDPDEPDVAITFIKLEAILAEDAIATAIEEAVSHAQERIAGIVARAVAARRAATEAKRPHPTPKSGRKPEMADRVVFE